MAKYPKELPTDKNNNVYPAPPAFKSNQSQNGVPIASSVLTLNANTTVLQVMVVGGTVGNSAVLGKWGSASVTGTNYDFMVPSGFTMPFVVPVSIMGTSSSIQGANPQNGLYPTVAFIAATAQSSSVFTAEY